VVPDTVPEDENFSQQLMVRLTIKSQSNAQAETVANINISYIASHQVKQIVFPPCSTQIS